MIKKILAKIDRLFTNYESLKYAKFNSFYKKHLIFSNVSAAYPSRNQVHAYMHHHYHNMLPQEIKNHRKYFSEGQRGFGEDAFHSMWWLIFKEFAPLNCLEIGVYRGQVISLWGIISNYLKHDSIIHGISPFSSVGDDVSSYSEKFDYQSDTELAFEIFGLKKPTLIKALSNSQPGIEHIKSKAWDLIYIDGSHDYDIALSDYQNSVANLKVGGILVMDDSSLFTDFNPPKFSFAGHSGPSQVMKEYAMKELKFIAGIGHNNVFVKK